MKTYLSQFFRCRIVRACYSADHYGSSPDDRQQGTAPYGQTQCG